MKLNYPTINENLLLSSDDVNMTNINKILSQLARNDFTLANPHGYAPKIWECKWYNDDQIDGYPEGYAIWYNTENTQQFIEFNHEKIYNYAKNNTYLKNIIQPYTVNTYNMYYNILTGYHIDGTSITLQPLFDIGQLSAAAQIKVSTTDNNKTVPSDSKYWKDFIINDNYSGIEQILSSMLSDLFEEHMQNYHFGNNSFAESIVDYLNKDLSNVKNVQKYQSHVLKCDTEGFDYVKEFVRQPFVQSFYNSVFKDHQITTYWKLKYYDQHADKNGRITSTAKQNYKEAMQYCANYISDDVEASIDQLVDTAIVNITYTAAKSASIVPYTTKTYADISSKAALYNCTYDLVKLTAAFSSDVSSNIDMYNQIATDVSTYYPVVNYTYYKWYRLWNSGYLEHGGILPISVYGFNHVDFDWKFQKSGSTYHAPIYDYPESINSFYGIHDKLEEGNETKYDQTGNLSYKNRYTVSLTPIACTLSGSLSGNGISYPISVDSNNNYVENEINSMKNNGFDVFVDTLNIPYYSYYASGYKTT